ncbi:hypothetical protein KUCAC02_020028 [Chaenocephalus aceratus]|uniref:Uncharacterized protein n=1 Tax=Chaenocephalus aceratus TaxID=36190 RepID=A0ACB9VQI9_CHAAC|nr:hypothetical protein KUCAC02_020028 [Chaenocephalus aceratus]
MLLVLRAVLLLGLASLLHAARRDQAVSLSLGNGSRLRLVMDPSVQSQRISTSDSSIANMSLSPWTYRDSSWRGGGEDAALEARPIYYQVLVLHKILRQVHNHKAGGRKRRQFDFRLETEVITVGCTCVRPSVVPQRP